MLRDLLPFVIPVDTVFLAGAALWSLALYLSLTTLRHWIEHQLTRWFNFADRSLYMSAKDFEASRPARESFNSLSAVLMTLIPFLVGGVACHWFVELSLGQSWGVSGGILACVGCGIYELGRRSTSDPS
ncbi:hypothetical protein PN441_13330 [Spirulina major CS-329]|uniref:hypothetical protein n=1 Tax=Spirulina TaxID=1154 RepID=UPI00232EB7DC|nr:MULTISPECIES: hypothetical protein [Spirulina]MDB9495404.1 hypothetical protein [Spirulina subsalsa CS-330]MDB9504052.1 hypothetical protein [Spirulina major CS-329]